MQAVLVSFLMREVLLVFGVVSEILDYVTVCNRTYMYRVNPILKVLQDCLAFKIVISQGLKDPRTEPLVMPYPAMDLNLNPGITCVFLAALPFASALLPLPQVFAYPKAHARPHACTCTCTHVRAHAQTRTCTDAYTHARTQATEPGHHESS